MSIPCARLPHSLRFELVSGIRSTALMLDGTLSAWYAVFYDSGASGNNSVVECDLAKVEVAGSNPVSRSIISFLARGIFYRRRRRQVVRQRSAKPPSPVQIRAAPPYLSFLISG